MAALHHNTTPVRTSHMIAAYVVGMLIGACIVGAIWHDVAHRDNMPNATTRACTPINTGGGVVQCDNPTTFDSAIVACFDNAGAYVGGTAQDTFRLMSQCVDDYMRMKGWW